MRPIVALAYLGWLALSFTARLAMVTIGCCVALRKRGL